MILTQALAEASMEDPDRIALVDSSQRVTFSELRKRIGKLSYLYQTEIAAGKPVAILSHNSIATAQTFFSLTNTGNPVLFLDPADSDESIVQDLKNLKITSQNSDRDSFFILLVNVNLFSAF